MATATYWQRGEALDYTNSGSTTIAANTVITFGDRIGIAGTDIEAGETGSLIVAGIFEMPKGSAAIGAGANVTWDGSAIAAAGNSDTVHGFAVAAAAADDTTVYVKINA